MAESANKEEAEDHDTEEDAEEEEQEEQQQAGIIEMDKWLTEVTRAGKGCGWLA